MSRRAITVLALAAPPAAGLILDRARHHRQHAEESLTAASLLYLEAVESAIYVTRLADAVLDDDHQTARDLIAVHREHHDR